MATISAFGAIRPNPALVNSLVQTAPQTESVVLGGYDDGPLVLKMALEMVARQRPETPEGQAGAYREISATMGRLVKEGILLPCWQACIYIYEVTHAGRTQTGVWYTTDLEDYRSGKIRIHELTFGERVRRLQHYREATGLEGSPILLTYPPDATINRLIAGAKAGKFISLGNESGVHRIWKITDEAAQQALTGAFARIGQVYLADGHHRIGSAAALAAEQKAGQQKVNDQITSLYMATEELQVSAFHRVVLPAAALDKSTLFKHLSRYYYLQEAWANHFILPGQKHKLGLLVAGEWYHLTLKPAAIPGGSLAGRLDAAILQEQVLGPIFGIADPGTDRRLKCIGGKGALEEVMEICMAHPAAVAFTLAPLTTEELIAVADAGEILPPKSTWINPKVPYGLLLYQYQPIH